MLKPTIHFYHLFNIDIMHRGLHTFVGSMSAGDGAILLKNYALLWCSLKPLGSQTLTHPTNQIGLESISLGEEGSMKG